MGRQEHGLLDLSKISHRLTTMIAIADRTIKVITCKIVAFPRCVEFGGRKSRGGNEGFETLMSFLTRLI